MNSEIFVKLPPTKLFFRCAIPSMITMAFVSLYTSFPFLLFRHLHYISCKKESLVL